MNEQLALRIGGVPEHFNLPWHLAIESGILADANLNVTWSDFPGGTGSMVEALNSNTVDVAMLLTEGAVHGLAHGGDYEIVSFYTLSPLLWGIHVPAMSDLKSVNDLENTTFAVSREGSGSHLMTYLLAREQGWDLDALTFELVGDLDGATELFRKTRSHTFLWERFMTQPFVDNETFRRVGNFPTPWPCFVVCVRKKVLNEKWADIEKLLGLVFDTAAELKLSPIASKLIAGRYGLKVNEVKTWLKLTEWNTSVSLDDFNLLQVNDTLRSVNLL